LKKKWWLWQSTQFAPKPNLQFNPSAQSKMAGTQSMD
jgi:hypothetical protein